MQGRFGSCPSSFTFMIGAPCSKAMAIAVLRSECTSTPRPLPMRSASILASRVRLHDSPEGLREHRGSDQAFLIRKHAI